METTLTAHRVEATIERDGTLTLEQLPFSPGERVEVIVLRAPEASGDDRSRSPHGRIITYDRPFDSAVDPDDWDAVR